MVALQNHDEFAVVIPSSVMMNEQTVCTASVDVNARVTSVAAAAVTADERNRDSWI
jgi:hypothetical protein